MAFRSIPENEAITCEWEPISIQSLRSLRRGVIYCVLNTCNKKRYIGKTLLSLEKRKQKHLENMHAGQSKVLYDALRKYGTDAFEWSILAECFEDELNSIERFFISFWHSYKKELGYNRTMGGDGGNCTPRDPEKARFNRSQCRLGKKVDEQHLVKWRARRHTPETRAKMVESAKLRWQRQKRDRCGV